MNEQERVSKWSLGKQIVIACVTIVILLLFYTLIGWLSDSDIENQIEDVMESLGKTQGNVTEQDTDRIISGLNANPPSVEIKGDIENLMRQLEGTASN